MKNKWGIIYFDPGWDFQSNRGAFAWGFHKLLQSSSNLWSSSWVISVSMTRSSSSVPSVLMSLLVLRMNLKRLGPSVLMSLLDWLFPSIWTANMDREWMTMVFLGRAQSQGWGLETIILVFVSTKIVLPTFFSTCFLSVISWIRVMPKFSKISISTGLLAMMKIFWSDLWQFSSF